MDSLIWYTGIFRIKSGILESSQESRNPAKIPKDSESRRRKFIVSGPSGGGLHRNLVFDGPDLFSLPNIKEKKAVWLRETRQYIGYTLYYGLLLQGIFSTSLAHLFLCTVHIELV